LPELSPCPHLAPLLGREPGEVCQAPLTPDPLAPRKLTPSSPPVNPSSLRRPSRRASFA
jgi:hypothetical protein